MPNSRDRLKNYLSLFTPSALSIVFIVFLAGVPLVLHQFDSIERFLRIPDNYDFVRIAAVWSDHFLTSLLGETKVQTLVVGGFWAIVGLGVYLFLRGLARFMIELDDDIVVRRYVWPKGADRSKPLRIMAERTAFRLVALVGLAIFIFGPLATIVKGPVLTGFLGPNKILQYVVWYLAGLFILHIITILLRLVVLRARILGD